jgi:hypothetical protein
MSTTRDETKLERIKARAMEFIELSKMAKYMPGRKIEDLDLFRYIPELTAPLLRDPKHDLWEDTDVDVHFAVAFGLGDNHVLLVGKDEANNGDEPMNKMMDLISISFCASQANESNEWLAVSFLARRIQEKSA